jgi:elongation factor Ts
MAEITAALVKELREKTGAGMMDCKRALSETGGKIEDAEDWLRKKGLSAAAKKAGRVAAEGLVGVTTGGKCGAIVEVNSETDFVARNETFQGFVRAVTGVTLAKGGDVETLKGASYPGSARSVGEELSHLIAGIGENMVLRRTRRLEVKDGVVASYAHGALVPGLGKIGALVALESTGNAEKLADLGRHLAMHVAASAPEYLDIASIDPAALERERQVQREKARASGKPDGIVEKMIEGGLRKQFYETVVLLEQKYIKDEELSVGKVIAAAAKEIGAPVKIAGFVRFALGEGIAKEPGDSAAGSPPR